MAFDWCSSASVATRNAAFSFNNTNSFSLWAECSRHHFICHTAFVKRLLAENPQRHKPPEANVKILLLCISPSCSKSCRVCEFSDLLFFLMHIKAEAGPEVWCRKVEANLITHLLSIVDQPQHTPIHAQSVLVDLQLCNNTTTDWNRAGFEPPSLQSLDNLLYLLLVLLCLNQTGFFLRWVSSIRTGLYLNLQHCQHCRY